MTFDYDLFVIGAGSGGVRAARMSAGFGAKVAIAEERYLGGTCVNVGCVPKKLFVYASQFREQFTGSAGYGWLPGRAKFQWPTLLLNKNREITRLNEVYRRLLVESGCDLIEGRARLVDSHTVEVNGRRLRAQRILVATGGWPKVPDIPGKEHAITSNDAFFLESLPKRILIVGGGYIAVEFAGIFNGLGVRTTLAYRGPLFLRGFDPEARQFLADEMRRKGVELMFDTHVRRIVPLKHGLSARLDGRRSCRADMVMYATGRNPNTANMGLEQAGVALDENGAVVVDGHYRTSVPSIYAIGDVTDRVNLTPVATAEGTALARALYGGDHKRVDYQDIPSCVFSQPSLGCVGLTEPQARDQYDEIDVFRSTFTPLKHSLDGSGEKTLIKVIVDKASDRVVGAHMVGPDAGEIIQGIAVAMKAHVTKTQLDATLGIHPTTAEEFVTLRSPN